MAEKESKESVRFDHRQILGGLMLTGLEDKGVLHDGPTLVLVRLFLCARFMVR